MTNYRDLIEDQGPHSTIGLPNLRIGLSAKGEALVQPSMYGEGGVYLEAHPNHLTNDEAMAIGLALIRCATEARTQGS